MTGPVVVALRRPQLAACALALMFLAGSLLAVHFAQLRAAAADVRRLEAQRLDDRLQIQAMERQTQALQRRNSASERAIEWIRRSLGTAKGRLSPLHATAPSGKSAGTLPLAVRLARLERASAQTQRQAGQLRGLAARVLVLRRLASIARARIVAAIPSLNPVDGAVNAAFGYRTDPFPEFHKGLDLAADYGTPVHAAAAGSVASAGWDGGFGIKIDLDHGNGYHTWYCHLSRTGVTAGERIAKGQPIGAVGSTGESTGPHLHYQLMHDGVAIDPLPFLHGVPAGVLASLHVAASVQ